MDAISLLSLMFDGVLQRLDAAATLARALAPALLAAFASALLAARLRAA